MGDSQPIAVTELPFRQVAEHLPTPCWIADAQGTILWVNRAWIAYTGKTVEDIQRSGLADLHDPAVLPEVRRRWALLRDAGEAGEMIFPLRGQDGRFRNFETCVAPIKDADGRVTRWFGTNTDVTAQTETQAALRASEEQLREIFDQAADGIFVSDAQGRILSINRAACAFVQRSREDLLGTRLSELVDAQDIPRLVEAQAAEAMTGEWRVRRADGGWAHLEVSTRALSDGRRLGVARDITLRAWAEQQKRRMTDEGRYQLLVDAITDYAVYMLDAEGIISSWNPGAQRFKGYRAEEVLGRHFSRFYTEEDRATGLPQRALATAAREGRFEGEGWRVRKDGTRFWAQVTIDPIRTPAGEVIGFAKITRDLTERREAQIALDLAREALFQSQKIEAVGRLTGGVAHDFNNLLMAVLGSLELVHKRLAPDPRITPLLENAIQGAQRGAALTQRMLAFARKQELKVEAVAAPQLVRGMMGLLRQSLGPAYEVDMRFGRDLPPVRTDANQLESALLNLCVNARDAMPKGGAIVIAAERRTEADAPDLNLEPGDYVCVSVTDSGEGMDEDTLRRAADPFFTTKGVGKGTGLGLSMVHGLAEQSGGRLRLSSRKGEGTTVEIWLPVAERPAGATSSARAADAGEAPPSLVILAADDDGLVLMNTVALLADLGHTVLEASSAKEALAILENETVDLLLTDEAMPQMTGSQLIEALRSTSPDLPVILASGYAEFPTGLAPDVVRLSKPYAQADLERALCAAVSAHPQLARPR